jgi:hypothetical protein
MCVRRETVLHFTVKCKTDGIGGPGGRDGEDLDGGAGFLDEGGGRIWTGGRGCVIWG